MNKVERIVKEIADYVGEPAGAVRRNSKFEKYKLGHGDFSVFDSAFGRDRCFKITGWLSWTEVHYVKSYQEKKVPALQKA